MWSILKRWLGWEADVEFYGEPRLRRRPSSATAHLFQKAPPPSRVPTPQAPSADGRRMPRAATASAKAGRPAEKPTAAAKAPAARAASTTAGARAPAAAKPGAAPGPAATKAAPAARQAAGRPAKPKAPVRKAPRVEPTLEIEKPPDPHFDPYNTGQFDRSASWERISKSQR